MRRLLAPIAVFAAACSSGTDGLDCPQGTISVGDVCRTRCFGDEECVAGERCVNNACTPPESQKDAGAACLTNSDCDQPSERPWGECSFSTVCDRTGQRRRVDQSTFCNGGRCMTVMEDEVEECPRETDGMECSPIAIGSFGACVYENECSTEGWRRRAITTFSCAGEECKATTTDELEACPPRATEHMPCGVGFEEILGPCESIGDECALDGVQEVTTKSYGCRDAECVVTGRAMTTAMCMRAVEQGAPCAGDAGHCCDGLCSARDDPLNCGVCGAQCSPNAACESYFDPLGEVRFACGCEVDDHCSAYGPNASCVRNMIPIGGLCRCECPIGQTQCANVCPSGDCYSSSFFGYCDYP